jgi:acyl transferase domain-containing protein
MGKELIHDFPSFAEDIAAMDKVLASLPHPPEWTIEEELLWRGNAKLEKLTKSERALRLRKAELAQPLCTAIQVAMVNLLRKWGIAPSGVVGHSSGEIAAAYAAGAITAAEAITVAYYRGQVAKAQTRPGGMAAVGLGRDEMEKYLVKGVVIACENSPSSVTLSGDVEELDGLLQMLKEQQPEIFARRLQVEMAYHSGMYLTKTLDFQGC